MLNLVLIGCSTAFLLAVTDPLMDILSIFINNIALKAFTSLLFSFGAVFLLDISPYKTAIVTVIAGAFLGSFFLAAAERVATYKPAVINPTRTNN